MSKANKAMSKAKENKYDEFYTFYNSIDDEMRQHLAVNPDLFRDKVVYCNCDHPIDSQFVNYFLLNFPRLGIKKLISTCLAVPPMVQGTVQVVTYNKETDIVDLTVSPLLGDGDFRSSECLAFLDEADIVVTNPPFSLFREFVKLLVDNNKTFLIIGSKPASITKDILPLFVENKLHFGFTSPKVFLTQNVIEPLQHFGNIGWFTNLPVPVKKLPQRPTKFQTYLNYPAINIDRLEDIPPADSADGYKEMGVPITFLEYYDSSEFKIIQYRYGLDGKPLLLEKDGKPYEPFPRIIIQRIK